MDNYFDIRLRPNPELAAAHLLAALFTRLHRALVELQTDAIGVSFPDYDARLGTLGLRLRLCGPKAALEPLAAGLWLGSMRDHVSVAGVMLVPAHAVHRTLRRVQVKSSPERLRRRLLKRHQLSEEQARQRIPESIASATDLPYVLLGSASTGQRFRLFLELGPEQPQPDPGRFNAYGLSATATVPWF